MSVLFERSWRYVITDLECGIVTVLDRLAADRTITPVLDQPLTLSCSVPSDDPQVNIGGDAGDPFVDYNDRILWAFRLEQDGTFREWGAGLLMQIEDEAGTEGPRSHLTAFDPWKYLYSRPVTRDDSLLPTNELSFEGKRGDEVALELLTNTDVAHGNCYIDYGQTGFYEGTIEATSALPDGYGFDQGSSVGAAWDKLCSDGFIDIVLTPVYDPANRPGIIAELNVYALAGQPRYDAIFAWDRPSRSLSAVSHLIDGSAMANKVRFYTGDGKLAGALLTDAASVAKYGQWWAQEFAPGDALPAGVAGLAAAELLLRRRGKDTLTVTPVPERAPWPLRDYALGDCVPYYASSALRVAVDSDPTLGCVPGGLQRVYGIPIKVGDDGTETVEGLLLSPPETA